MLKDCSKKKEKNFALAETRTRIARVAGEHSTLRPPVLLTFSFIFFLSPSVYHSMPFEIVRFSLTEADGRPSSEETLSSRKRVLDGARCINATVLPVSYAESFYNSLFRYPEDFSVAWLAVGKTKKGKEESMGALVARPDKKAGAVSILTLAVLTRHRGKGVGKRLVERVVEECVKRSEKKGAGTTTAEGSCNNCPWDELEVYVQKDNEEGIRFYIGQGFSLVKGMTVENYYRRVSFGSSTAVVLRRPAIVSKRESAESLEPPPKKVHKK